MSEQFKVGDVVILQHTREAHWLVGEECTIIRGLEKRRIYYSTHSEIGACYIVQFRDGKRRSAYPYQLRRKPPKQSYDAWATEKVQQVTKPVNVPEVVA